MWRLRFPSARIFCSGNLQRASSCVTFRDHIRIRLALADVWDCAFGHLCGCVRRDSSFLIIVIFRERRRMMPVIASLVFSTTKVDKVVDLPFLTGLCLSGH